MEILVGMFVGVLVGLTGLGGGVILLPILVFGFGIPPVVAVGSDAVFSAVTKLGAGIVHYRHRTVDWVLVRYLASGSIPGAIAGVLLLAYLRSVHAANVNLWLRQLIGVMLVLVPIVLLAGARVPARTASLPPRQLRRVLVLMGLFAGFLVGLTSIGSCSIIMSMLLLVVAASPAVLVGTDIVHALLLTSVTGLLHTGMGNVDLRLVAALVIGSVPGAVLGARLSSSVPKRWLKFALCLLLVVSGLRLLQL